MKEEAVLRVSRTDDENAYVLVHVVSSGRKGLEFSLEATEGAYPYWVDLKQKDIPKQKDKKHPIAEDEWERILTEVLLDRQSDPDIEVVAQVAEGQDLMLIIRRSISGIKQRIGTITLDCDEDRGLDLFDWCGTALLSKKDIKADLDSVSAKAAELENAVKELKDQLEELIEAKKAEESELLLKFRDLLNEKKVKIREQQRLLLAAGNIDPEELGAVAPSPSGRRKTKSPPVVRTTTGRGHVAKASGKGKRKAAEPEPEEDDDDEEEGRAEPVRQPGRDEEAESDDALDKMEVDKKHGEEDSEEERETDDEATASDEDEDDNEDEEPAPATRRGGRSIDKPPAANTRHAAASQRKTASPPPPRSLASHQRKAASKPAEPDPEGSETESDDEL